MSDALNKTIGIFDSGVGGTSLVVALRKRAPGIPLIYVADTARFPYGNRNPRTVLRYSKELCSFLIDRGVSTVVFGCTTASSAALPHLQCKLAVPSFGVIEPTIEQIVQLPAIKRVGILATPTTIRLGLHKQLLAAKRPDICVFGQPCPLLASAVERGDQSKEGLLKIIHSYIDPLLEQKIDALLLGCTHYSFLSDHFKALLPRECLIIDPADLCVDALVLAKAVQEDPTASHSRCQFFTTGNPSSFSQTLQTLLQYSPDSIEHLPLQKWSGMTTGLSQNRISRSHA